MKTSSSYEAQLAQAETEATTQAASLARLEDMVGELELQIQKLRKTANEFRHQQTEAEERFRNLLTMTPEQFEDNLKMAETYARITGSVSATHNGVRWER